jgi:phosphotransferase system HPr-like phosphotransfer protein
MPFIKKSVTINLDDFGLHARPISSIVRRTLLYKNDVYFMPLEIKPETFYDAKSIMDLLEFEGTNGKKLEVQVEYMDKVSPTEVESNRIQAEILCNDLCSALCSGHMDKLAEILRVK